MFAAGVSTMTAQNSTVDEDRLFLDSIVEATTEEFKPVQMGTYADDFATFGSIRVYGADSVAITDAKVIVVPNGYPYARQEKNVSKDAPFANYFAPKHVVSDVKIIPQGKFANKYDWLNFEEKLTGGVRDVYLPLDK